MLADPTIVFLGDEPDRIATCYFDQPDQEWPKSGGMSADDWHACRMWESRDEEPYYFAIESPYTSGRLYRDLNMNTPLLSFPEGTKTLRQMAAVIHGETPWPEAEQVTRAYTSVHLRLLVKRGL